MATKNYSSEYINNVEVFRVENDINGNPRYVVHYLSLLTDKERDNLTFEECWRLALSKARKEGGKVYRASWFGGGIVLQSYNIEQTIKDMFK